jgi:hypothetical protein
MKRYYSKDDEAGDGEDRKYEKEENDSVYNMFSYILSWLLFG